MEEYNKKIIDAMLTLGLYNQIKSKNEIKKAYFQLCKKYHPDQIAPNEINRSLLLNRYLKIQSSYELLETVSINQLQQIYIQYKESTDVNRKILQNDKNNINKIIQPNQMNNKRKREAKVFSTNKEAARQQARQQSYAFDKKRMEKIYTERKKKEVDYENQAKPITNRNEQDELLRKIETIWLAEVIRRQIKEDKMLKEKENIKKLYKAFMKREDLT